MHKGQCNCGGVAFTIATEELRPPSACHCSQCRRWSGHVWSGTTVKTEDLSFQSDGPLTWFRSSAQAERGFCSDCGSSLFYRPIDSDHVSVAVGSLEGPTGTHLRRHIFVGSKGDYYDIADGLPQFETW